VARSWRVVEPDAVAEEDEPTRSDSDGTDDDIMLRRGWWWCGEGMKEVGLNRRSERAAAQVASVQIVLRWRAAAQTRFVVLTGLALSLSLSPSPSIRSTSDVRMASLLEWDEDAVGHFLHTHGFPDLSAEIHGIVSPLSLPPIALVPPSDSLLLPSSIPEHAISGEVLAMLESDDLKDIGVSSLGMRLGILKAVEALKLEQGLTSAPDDAYDLSC
jgi:hypothetical protein